MARRPTFAIASTARGRPAAIAVAPGGTIAIHTIAGLARDDSRFAAIPRRQSTRSRFDGRRVTAATLAAVEAAGASDGVACRLFTGAAQREAIAAMVVAGNSAQLDDPAFVAELRRWVRFNADAAAASGDGLFSGASGQATVPTWLGTTRRPGGVGRRRTRLPALCPDGDGDRLRTAIVNQAVEVPAVRADLARWLSAPDRRLDLVVRFGCALALPFSWRRPAAAVIPAA